MAANVAGENVPEGAGKVEVEALDRGGEMRPLNKLRLGERMGVAL